MVLLVALACGSPPPAIVLHGLLERSLTLDQLHNYELHNIHITAACIAHLFLLLGRKEINHHGFAK